MRGKCCLMLAVLVGVFGCHSPHHVLNVVEPEGVPESRPFRPERMRAAVEGRPMPEIRQKLAGVWKFRVTVAGAVQEVSVGHFADRGDRASVSDTGVVSVRLPSDSGPGQTWEVEAAFDFDQPVLWEKGLLVWRFAKPVSVIRVG